MSAKATKPKLAAVPAGTAAVYPKRQGSRARPWHVWDEHAKKDLPHRYYSDPRRALDAALVLVKWAKVGALYTVYNVRGKWLATYYRGPTGITIQREEVVK